MTKDLERYQTVYARVPGSVAAPTAGLHFTEPLLRRLTQRGIGIARITLHVGYGTFLPVTAAQAEDHVLESEFFELDAAAAATINGARRVIAVGTTSTRVLETASDAQGFVRPQSDWTRLFIYPGYRFRRVDALLTNYHLPRSSLLLLVSAFAGTALIRQAYEQAIAQSFRFYSYGDCMLIL
jgi:S-adenosylmethionine:tRNA ribosyltransferase-isomerase